MCSFMIRELKFKKVVFSMYSPIMGGYSKWHILQDKQLEILVDYFGIPPEVVGGLLEHETEQLWNHLPKEYKDAANNIGRLIQLP